MAGGLTRDDVFAACEALASDGVAVDKITGHAAWSRLGRGSKSTVQKYWTEWRALKDSSSPLTKTAAMLTIQQIIDQLVYQAVEDEQHRTETIIAQLEQEVRQLGRGLATALADVERLTAGFKAATASAELATDGRTRAEAERDWLKEQLAERDEELADAHAGRRNREREIAKAAGRLTTKLPPKER